MNSVGGEFTANKSTGRQRRDLTGLLPVAAAILYPFLLDLFHALVGAAGSPISSLAMVGAALFLAAAFAVPLTGILVANRSMPVKPAMRRLAYLAVAAPTLYVFLGVVNYMAKSAYPDELLWVAGWFGMAAWAWYGRGRAENSPPDVARGRTAHALIAATLAAYVLFHLFNHLTLWAGTGPNTTVAHWGERAYRAPAVEILLASAMPFMCLSGGYLAWRWSAAASRYDFFRTFQIASGVFLMVYIAGHMDSVFIYARLYLGIPTDWKFATGAPAGMIHDPWNIRLLPHYLLAVFFMLGHAATGLRGILLAHGMPARIANRLWGGAIALAAGIALAIIAGMVSVAPGIPADAAPHALMHPAVPKGGFR